MCGGCRGRLLLYRKNNGGVAFDEIVQDAQINRFGDAVLRIVEVVNRAIRIGVVEVDTIVLPRKLVLVTQVEHKFAYLNNRDNTDSCARP